MVIPEISKSICNFNNNKKKTNNKKKRKKNLYYHQLKIDEWPVHTEYIHFMALMASKSCGKTLHENYHGQHLILYLDRKSQKSYQQYNFMS